MSDELPPWQLEFRALATTEIQARIKRILENREFLSVWTIPTGWRETQEQMLLEEAWPHLDSWTTLRTLSFGEQPLKNRWASMSPDERVAAAQSFLAYFYDTKHMHHW